MHTNPNTGTGTDFFAPSAYDAVNKSAKLLSAHFHNNRI